MESGIMEFSLKPGIIVRSKNFGAFISHMENSNDLWAIKDHESRFVYANSPFLYYNNFPKFFSIEGRLDSECPAPWAEAADIIQANDITIMKQQKNANVLTNFIYGKKEKIIQPFLFDVTPLIKDGKSIGIIGRAKKLDLYSMYNCDQEPYSPSVPSDYHSLIFTDREFDVVYFAMQSLNVNDISKKLSTPIETIDNYMQSIYQKACVNSLTQLIEFCNENGYHKFAPNRCFNSNPYIPLT
ncbi:PAS domain-containing protein [Acerihabitans sp. KWT182]|uniref:PAS domain-containing protein n=1 Tax=Acerihabitans sp. KWT182 TaxID=3157919 RepID=A0AAU7Q8Y0_9GAMM